MIARTRTCPRCGGRMEQGFIADATDSTRKVPKWVEGVAEVSIWLGVKTRGRRQLAVETYRCHRCALLESYAPES